MNTCEPAPVANDTDAKVRRVELLISGLLRAGVALSLALVVTGTLLSFVHHPAYVSSKTELRRLTEPGAAFPHTVSDVIRDLHGWQGRAFVAAGLLILIATPVMRVAVSILGFVYQKDRTFTVITSVVLALLLLSFILGRVEK